MRPAVQGNDARVVDHLVRDCHVALRLEDSHIVVVARGKHHERQPDGDAPIPQAAVLRRVGGTASAARRLGGRGSLTCSGRKSGQPAVWWVDDQRAASRARCQVFVPMRRTGAHRAPGRHSIDVPGACPESLLQVLPIKEDFVSNFDRAFKRDREIVVGGPDSFEVGIAPRCSGVCRSSFRRSQRVRSLPRRPR
jgi:hypothetical protein